MHDGFTCLSFGAWCFGVLLVTHFIYFFFSIWGLHGNTLVAANGWMDGHVDMGR